MLNVKEFFASSQQQAVSSRSGRLGLVQHFQKERNYRARSRNFFKAHKRVLSAASDPRAMQKFPSRAI